jgi:glycosyltransferase involved in cell wall biosynthesis
LCHFLVDRGVRVHFAYSDRRGSEQLQTLAAWIEECGGRTLNLGVANRPELRDFTALRALRRLVEEVRPDVIHSHSAKAGFLARILSCLGCRAAQVYHPHAYVGMRAKPGRFDSIYNLIERALGRLSCTVVVSSGEEDFARKRLHVPEARVRLLPNGVDLDRFSPAGVAEKRSRRMRLGLPIDRPILGFMARSSAQKDPVTLYRAFAHAVAVRPMALFHVGHGELDEELERIIAEHHLGEHMHRCPYTSEPAEFYRIVDGFVLTSRYEGCSLAALEALAANLPLILSRAPGNEDLLALPLSHSWSAEPGDVGGFARAIEAWSETVEATGIAINHRAIAREQFDRRQTCEAVFSLYRDLAPGARVPEGGSIRTGFRQQ